MSKIKHRKGFTPLECVFIILILVIVFGAGYVVYKHNHKTLASSTANTNDSSKWLPYVDTKSGFSADFPTSPNYSKTPEAPNPVTQTINGTSVVVNNVISSNNINTSYTVLSLKYPNNAKLPNLSSSFPSYQDKHIINSQRTTVDGKSAETYELTAIRRARTVTEQGKPVTLPAVKLNNDGEFILDGKVVYELDAVHSGNTTAPDAQHFINSFKLIK